MDKMQRFMTGCMEISREPDIRTAFQICLDTAIDVIGCEAGTLYVVELSELVFKIMRNRMREDLNGQDPDMPPVPADSRHHLCALALHQGIIQIDDVYSCDRYDLSGTREYDERNRYRTRSVLVIPIITRGGEPVAVLQLINALAEDTGVVCAFDPKQQEMAELLASQLALVLSSRIYEDELRKIRNSMTENYKGMDLPEEVGEGLSSFVAENYYGTLSEQRFDRAVEELTREGDPDTRRFLMQKQARRRHDRLPGLIRVRTEDTARQLASYANTVIGGKRPTDYLRELVDASGLKESLVADRANLHRSSVNAMLNGKRTITKDSLFALAIALDLTLEQTEKLMESNGMAIQGSVKRDVVLQYFISLNETRQNRYGIVFINSILHEMGEAILGQKYYRPDKDEEPV